MQLKLGEDAAQKKRELKLKKKEEQKERKRREQRKRYFEQNFKYGSTKVMKHNGKFFFKGDIAHCGKQNIFHNARKIKAIMEKKQKTMGYMDYADLPSFYSNWSWEREERERKEIYEEDLYRFDGDKIVIAELIGSKPIRQMCENGVVGDACDSKDEDEDEREGARDES
jgi:hypothetical protein